MFLGLMLLWLKRYAFFAVGLVALFSYLWIIRSQTVSGITMPMEAKAFSENVQTVLFFAIPCGFLMGVMDFSDRRKKWRAAQMDESDLSIRVARRRDARVLRDVLDEDTGEAMGWTQSQVRGIRHGVRIVGTDDVHIVRVASKAVGVLWLTPGPHDDLYISVAIAANVRRRGYATRTVRLASEYLTRVGQVPQVTTDQEHLLPSLLNLGFALEGRFVMNRSDGRLVITNLLRMRPDPSVVPRLQWTAES